MIFYFSVPVYTDLHEFETWSRDGYKFRVMRYHFHCIEQSADEPRKMGEIRATVNEDPGTKRTLDEIVILESIKTDFSQTLCKFFLGSEVLKSISSKVEMGIGIDGFASAKAQLLGSVDKAIRYETNESFTINRTYHERVQKEHRSRIELDGTTSRVLVAPQYYRKRLIDCYMTHIDWLTVSYDRTAMLQFSRKKNNLPSAVGSSRRKNHPNWIKLNPYQPLYRFSYWQPLLSFDWISEKDYIDEVGSSEAITVEPLTDSRNFVAEVPKIPTLYQVSKELFPRLYDAALLDEVS